MNENSKANGSCTTVHHKPKRRMKIRAGMKYRIFPNKEQQQKLAVQFRHSRFVYNTYLAVRHDYYAATGKRSNYNTCANDLQVWLHCAGRFVQFVKHKQHWNRGVTHQVDRWFASSKLCFACDAKHQKMSLSLREWRCTQCGTLHDRDENASQNILAESLNTLGAREMYAQEIRESLGARLGKAQLFQHWVAHPIIGGCKVKTEGILSGSAKRNS
ncbi:MAG: zinc ribbon domain-containing protein [Candidatus Promineifilaceae bacterium]